MPKKSLKNFFNSATNFLLIIVFLTIIISSFLITLSLNPRSQKIESTVLGTSSSTLKVTPSRESSLNINELTINSIGVSDLSVTNYNFTSILSESNNGLTMQVRLRDLKNSMFTGELLKLSNKSNIKKNLAIYSKIPEQYLNDLNLALIINGHEYTIYDDYGNKETRNLNLSLQPGGKAKISMKIISYKPISYSLAFEFDFNIPN